MASVHRSSFAGADSMPLHITACDNGGVNRRTMLDQPRPPLYAPIVKFKANADHLQRYDVRLPALAVNKGIYTLTGKSGPAMVADADTYRMVSYHFMTSIDEDNLPYYWLQHRNIDPRDEDITRKVAAGANGAFEYDRATLRAVRLGWKKKTMPTTGLLLAQFPVGRQKILQRDLFAQDRTLSSCLFAGFT